MLQIFKDYSVLYPMAPLGGLFVALIGGAILIGSPVPRFRLPIVYAGFVLGTLAMIFGGKIVRGLPKPTAVQVVSLALAIAIEIVAFAVLMPRLRPQGLRAILIATLAIVGVHFLIMLPAFGPLIGLLGFLCVLNAALAWRSKRQDVGSYWFIDGLLKSSVGIALLMTSPRLY